jgi:biotin carboxyl carrier protein
MSLDIKIDDRKAKVKFLEMNDNIIKIQVDEKVYEVDVVRVGDMIYSLIYKGKSFNIEMIEGQSKHSYYVNSLNKSYNVEIRDPASRLKLGKGKDEFDGDGNQIHCPMPAKIVKVLVKEGDAVKKNQTIIVVNAMKMEIDFKAKRDGTVKKVHVKPDDTVAENALLVDLV